MNLNKRIITAGLVVFLTACTSTEKRVEEAAEKPAEVQTVESIVLETPPDLSYRVRPGDFLSRIARKTTGDGENWREIARYNNIKSPNKLKKNDTIMIPGHLLPVDRSIKHEKQPAVASIEDEPTKIVAKPQEKTKELYKPSSHSEWVMVEGSYYPKAVYRKPDYSAGMLTRVLPGTTLKHIKSDKNWIQVETEKGQGYLHRSDARRLGKNELSLKTSSEY